MAPEQPKLGLPELIREHGVRTYRVTQNWTGKGLNLSTLTVLGTHQWLLKKLTIEARKLKADMVLYSGLPADEKAGEVLSNL